MTRRIRLFQLFAIDVFIDWSWIACAGLIGWTLARDVLPELTPGLPPAHYWLMAAAGTAGLFASILLHEFAHSLVARRFGISVRSITLFIFGGMAEMEHEPPSARSELFTAAAGPAASLLFAGLFFLGETATIALGGPDAVTGTLWYLAMANAMLFLFNLVPAFPLDGGRVLRAALWAWRGDLMGATSIAAAAGSAFGVFLMLVGALDIATGNLSIGLWNLLIGLFIRGAAQAGREEAVMQALLAGVSVGEAMNRSPIAVSPDLSVEDLVEKVVYRFPHSSFPVCRLGRLVGMVTLDRLSLVDPGLRALTRVHEVMTPPGEEQVVPPGAELLAVLRRMRPARRRSVWVAEEGRLVGVLTLQDVQHYLSARSALLRRRLSWSGFSVFP